MIQAEKTGWRCTFAKKAHIAQYARPAAEKKDKGVWM